MDPALQEIIREGLNPLDEIEAIIKLRDPRVLPPKVKVITQLGNVITCRVRRGNIRELYESDRIKSFKASRYISTEPDEEFDGAEAGYYPEFVLKPHAGSERLPGGQGVVVGILDWGLDFAHPNFRNRDGTTRIRAIWDQSADAPNTLQPYGYGKLYTRERINMALKQKYPYRYLGYHPAAGDPRGSGAHGTVVADIAAGNGSIGMQGVAPDAEIIFVHLSSREIGPLSNLGDSVRILEAIDFISNQAGEDPCVINMSVGRHGGHHMGTSLVEQGMDAFLAGRPNRVICQSTGNYHHARAHASGVIRPGKPETFRFQIDPADRTANELEVWYSGSDEIIFELSNESNKKKFRCDLDQKSNISMNGSIVGRIYHRSNEPNTGLNNINAFLYKNAPAGSWQGQLFGKKILDGRYHAYVERDGACRYCQSRFSKKDADNAFTTGTICNGYNTIAVGAYDGHARQVKLAPFSSKGPTADGRVKPDLIAPGVRVLAARSTPGHIQRATRLLTRMSGTSMAAPHVTGTVALMLQKIIKPVTVHQIRNILLGSTDAVRVAPEDQLRVGSGVLNLRKVLRNVRRYNQKQMIRSQRVNQKAIYN